MSGDDQRIGPGALVAVVGGSGAGKDALMGYARERMPQGVCFPRRVITRAAGPGEDFEPRDEATFDDEARSGAFAIWWRAHGLCYGIPASVDDEVRRGAVVVVNVSRGVLDRLSARYERLIVVRISVSDEVRAARLHARGREETREIRERLTRQDPAPDFPVDVEIRNDGTLVDGGEQLLRAIVAATTVTAG